jgi:pyruvate ferredoxin oxidoreductase gamma subunit/phenylglyoxylate dehydrogenase gamma subunit
MVEIRFHGRGGQGAVLAAQILAKALVVEGKYIKGVPSFGFERRGAPVAAFLRFDDHVIRQTTNIYRPDWIVCLDPTLFKTVDIFEGVKDSGGILVQATAHSLNELTVPPRIVKVGLCDAVRIALDVFGRSITNTVMLGALVRTTAVVSLDCLTSVLAEIAFRDAVLESNVEAVRRGYQQTVVHTIQRRVRSDEETVTPHV